MSMSPDLQPDVDEVLQTEQDDTPRDGKPEPPVDVRVNGSVRTQELPHKAGATRTRPVVSTTPIRLLAADHRRARASVMSIGQNMYVAFNSASASDVSTMMLWPANVPFIVLTATEVWVASATATTSVSFATELWATGEGDA